MWLKEIFATHPFLKVSFKYSATTAIWRKVFTEHALTPLPHPHIPLSDIIRNMIEIREFKNSKNDVDYQLLIDGLVVDNVDFYSVFDSLGADRLSTFDFEASNKIAAHAFSEFPPLYELSLRHKVDWLEVVDFITIKGHLPTTPFIVRFNLSKWHRPYSFNDYFRELVRLYEASGEQGIDLHVIEPDKEKAVPMEGFMLSFSCSPDLPLISELNRNFNILHKFHEEAVRNLATKSSDNSITLIFDFPVEIKTSCEQYLLYFIQFLQDLGVEAKSELKDEAGKVLFSVTPTNTEHALDNIRAALDVYLHLSSSPISDTANESIAIQRLESNILRLRSGLKLAAAEIQAKNATIQAHELTISIQKGLLSGEIIIDSLKDVTPKPKDTEEMLGGTLAIKKYEGKGFDLDLPEIFRRLKKLFTDKE